MTTSVRLGTYDNSWYLPGAGLLKRSAWFFLGRPVVRSAWIPSSALRVALLRCFGAEIGTGVVIKPSVDIKYPWHLVIGDDCWIGEQVWIDNLTTVRLGSDVCLSQGTYLCTGNHDWSDPGFGLMIAPIQLSDRAWAGARSTLLPGTFLETGAIAAAGSVVSGTIPEYAIYAGNPARFIKRRIVRSHSAQVSTEKQRTTL